MPDTKLRGVNVTDVIVPYGTTAAPDPYAVIDPVWGIGGQREVADLTELNAITTERRRQGMHVYVADSDGGGTPCEYRLKAAPWSGLIGDWEVWSGGDGTVTSVTVTGSDGVTITGTVPITSTGTVDVGLGDITPTSVAATGTVTGSNLSGTNTGDQTITLTGDVTGSGTGTFVTTIAVGAISTTTLADGSVTFPKIAPMHARTLLGNPTGSLAAPEEITLGTGLSFSGTTLSASGSGGTVTSITAGAGLSGGTITTTGTIALSTIGNNSVLANISGLSAVPTSVAATALIDAAFGSAQGSVLYRGNSTWAALGPGTNGQVLTTHGAGLNPTWASAAGTVSLVGTGAGLTGGPITSTGTISLANIPNARLLANTSGSTGAPTATTVSQIIDAGVGNTRGSILYRGANSAGWSILPPGFTGQFLQTQGTGADPQWATAGGGGTVTSITAGAGLSGGTITTTGTISLAAIADGDLLANTSGLTAAPVATTLSGLIDYAIGFTQGDILYRSGTAWAALTPGTAGQYLSTNGAAANPSWADSGIQVDEDGTLVGFRPGLNLIAGDGVTITAVDDAGLNLVDVTISATGTGGTVTSVATGTGLTGGPITDTGTISLAAIADGDLLANTSGGSAAPVPTTLTEYLDKTVSNTVGDLIYRSSSGGWAALTGVGSAKLLVGTGLSSAMAWVSMSGDATIAADGTVTVSAIGGTTITFPLSVDNGGTGFGSVSLGDTFYGGNANVIEKLGGNSTTTQKFLSQTGTGATSAAPSWQSLSASSITGLAPGSHSFGVSGAPALDDVTPPIFSDRAFTCDGLTIACGTAPSGGPVTVTIETSTDGTTWGSLASGAVSATDGTYSGTQACTTAVAANTYLRGKFTAVNSAANVTAVVFIRS